MKQTEMIDTNIEMMDTEEAGEDTATPRKKVHGSEHLVSGGSVQCIPGVSESGSEGASVGATRSTGGVQEGARTNADTQMAIWKCSACKQRKDSRRKHYNCSSYSRKWDASCMLTGMKREANAKKLKSESWDCWVCASLFSHMYGESGVCLKCRKAVKVDERLVCTRQEYMVSVHKKLKLKIEKLKKK